MGHVLVVEDDKALREGLTELLESAEFEVTAVGNGLEALVALGNEPLPDVLVLDLMMPHLSGWELLTELRRDARLRDVPVVVASAIAPGPLHEPVDALVRKPFDPAALVELVRDLAERRSLAPLHRAGVVP